MGFEEVREFDYGQVSGIVTVSWIREDYVWIGTRRSYIDGEPVEQAIRFREAEWDFSANLRLVDGEWKFDGDTIHIRKLGTGSLAPVPAPRTYAERICEAMRKLVVEMFSPDVARKAGSAAAEENYQACLAVRDSLRRELAVADEALRAALLRSRKFAE